MVIIRCTCVYHNILWCRAVRVILTSHISTFQDFGITISLFLLFWCFWMNFIQWSLYGLLIVPTFMSPSWCTLLLPGSMYNCLCLTRLYEFTFFPPLHISISWHICFSWFNSGSTSPRITRHSEYLRPHNCHYRLNIPRHRWRTCCFYSISTSWKSPLLS